MAEDQGLTEEADGMLIDSIIILQRGMKRKCSETSLKSHYTSDIQANKKRDNKLKDHGLKLAFDQPNKPSEGSSCDASTCDEQLFWGRGKSFSLIGKSVAKDSSKGSHKMSSTEDSTSDIEASTSSLEKDLKDAKEGEVSAAQLGIDNDSFLEPENQPGIMKPICNTFGVQHLVTKRHFKTKQRQRGPKGLSIANLVDDLLQTPVKETNTIEGPQLSGEVLSPVLYEPILGGESGAIEEQHNNVPKRNSYETCSKSSDSDNCSDWIEEEPDKTWSNSCQRDTPDQVPCQAGLKGEKQKSVHDVSGEKQDQKEVNRFWSGQESTKLLGLIDQEISPTVISQRHIRRTVRAIIQKIWVMKRIRGLVPARRFYSDEEEAQLLAVLNQEKGHTPIHQLSKLLNRNYDSLSNKLWSLKQRQVLLLMEPWTDEEEVQVRELLSRGIGIGALHQNLKLAKSRHAVEAKGTQLWNRLGRRGLRIVRWSDDEVTQLTGLLAQGISIRRIHQDYIVNRSLGAIAVQATFIRAREGIKKAVGRSSKEELAQSLQSLREGKTCKAIHDKFMPSRSMRAKCRTLRKKEALPSRNKRWSQQEYELLLDLLSHGLSYKTIHLHYMPSRSPEALKKGASNFRKMKRLQVTVNPDFRTPN
ncbi:hypothetical protein MMC24_000447 [Lignoscripta atroalba]|nr:hypothetical protein [Lignoscripta atroalba]